MDYPQAEVHVTSSFDRAIFVDAGDLDNDGDVDIVGASFSAHRICWWEKR